MTKEQIAKLDLSSGPLCCGIHEALVRRLLEERERLLRALEGLVDQLDGMREFVCPDGGAESIVAARNALALAEGPA